MNDPQIPTSCEKEVLQWRRWYIEKFFVNDQFTSAYFLSYPSEVFIQKTPEENLMYAMSAALQKYNEKK